MVGAPGPCGCGCALTPETSYGFAVDQFAREVLLAPLDPWQRWVAIHACEMIRDANGIWRPRFRRLILLVARQNGKTHLLKVLAAFWIFVQKLPKILGTSNLLEHAYASMEEMHSMVLEIPELEEMLPRGGTRGLIKDNNKPGMRTVSGSAYRVSAATKKAGRSKAIRRWICDETLQQTDWDCYNAAYYAMRAVRDAQAWFIGSQGDDRSVVLNALHKEALPYADGKAIDLDGEAVGLFEYSAPEDAETDDPQALAMANPNMNHENDHGIFGLEADAKAAKMAGGQSEAGFRTESMCIRVRNLDPAISPDAWKRCAATFTFPADRRAGVVDVSRHMDRVTLSMARWKPGGKVQLAVAKTWVGPNAVKEMRAQLPNLVQRLKIRKLGFLPVGPGAAILAAMQQRSFRTGVEVAPIVSDLPALAMGFAELVSAEEVEWLDNEGSEWLNIQALAVGKKHIAKRWEFDWTGDLAIEAVNAAAGAVHIARMMPAPVGPIRLVGPDD